MGITATHTYAELGLSKTAYGEIRDKLKAAGYNHAFMEDGAIDMHGIGVTVEVDDIDQLALDAACAVMKALTDSAPKPYAAQKAAVQVVIADAIRKCQTK